MLIDDLERERLPFDDSFAQCLLNSERQVSSQPALWVDEQVFTYGEMLSHGCAIAATLATMDWELKRCAVLAYRSAVAYQGIWGILLAGGCYTPLNPRFPVDKNESILHTAGCTTILVDKRSEEAARQLLCQQQQVMSVLMPEHSELPDWCHATPHHYVSQKQLQSPQQWQSPERTNRYAYTLFTSGTTGKPKGIAINHHNLKAYVDSVQERYPLTSRDRLTQMSDLTFDLSVHDMVYAWSAGACLYVIPENVLLSPADFVVKHKLTVWLSVPSLLGFMNKFGKIKPGAFPDLRYSFFCGESMPTLMAEKWRQASPNGKVVNIYGPTETTVVMTSFDFTMADLELGSLPLGKPFQGPEVIVVDQAGLLVEPGAQGEIWEGGTQVSDGYWRDEKRTQQSFVAAEFSGFKSKRWYRTGDLAVWDERYGLIFNGRKDFQVKINGFRVELGEIDTVVRSQFECDWVAAIPWPIDDMGAARGVVVWLSGAEANAQEVRQHCAKKLPPYMVPGYVFWRDELPRNANGKVDIKALQRLTEEQLRMNKS